MDPQTEFILFVSGTVGALSKSYIHSVSTSTIWDEACSAWLTWVVIYGGLRLYHLTRKAEELFTDPLITAKGGRRKADLGVLVVAAASIAAQILQAQNLLPFVSVRSQNPSKAWADFLTSH